MSAVPYVQNLTLILFTLQIEEDRARNITALN